MWGSRSSTANTSKGMNIEYQRIGENNEDIFVDPFADTSSNDTAPVSNVDYNLDVNKTIPSAPSSSSSSSFSSLFPSLGSSTTPSGTTTSSGLLPSTPVSLDHLSSNDLAVALNIGNVAGNAFNVEKVTADQADETAHYLHYEQRSLWGQASYNIGYSYFTGLMLGGSYGFLHGLRTSPNKWPRVLINSILNGCGKYGARSANVFGVIALVYTVTERQLENYELDKIPGTINRIFYPLTGHKDIFPKARTDTLIPFVTAFTTGVLFSIPRAATMRGIEKNLVTLPKRFGVILLGGVTTMVGVTSLSYLGPYIYGHRSPFRFA